MTVLDRPDECVTEEAVLWHLPAATVLHQLADRVAAVTVTDPPYSDETHAPKLESIRRNDGGKDRDLITFPPLTEAEAFPIAGELARVTRAWIVVFGDLESIHLWKRALTSAGCAWIRTGAWWKTDAQPQTTGDRPAQGLELIGLAHAPRPPKSGSMKWNGGGRHFRYQGPAQESVERVHPTQKPEWLMEALIRDFTQPGDLVLDPYFGSGTTAVAALRTGRRFVGSEIDPGHHARAVERVRRTRHQPQLFEAPSARPTQPGFGFPKPPKGNA